MSPRTPLKRKLAALGTVGLVAAGLSIAGATEASAANTYNQIRVCAQGDYWVTVRIAKDSAGNGVALDSPIIRPGTCWDTIRSTNGTTARLDFGGYTSANYSGSRYLGFGLWNSYSPIAIGAQGKIAGSVKLVQY